MSTFMGIFFVGFSIFWMTMAYRASGPFFHVRAAVCRGGTFEMVTTPLRAYWSRVVHTVCTHRQTSLDHQGRQDSESYPLERVDFVETEFRRRRTWTTCCL